MSDTVGVEGRVWSPNWSPRIPWCFFEELSKNGWRPDTKWAEGLDWKQIGPQCVHVLEPLPINPSDWWIEPYCCLAGTVVFYSTYAASHREVARCDGPYRMWPNISFVERGGLLYEVCSGKVVHVFDRWQHEWRAFKNTEVARHFNGICGGCKYCDLLREEAA